MKRKNALAFVFDAPGYAVILGMVVYGRNSVMFPGCALDKSTETFKPINTGDTLGPTGGGFLFSSTTSTPT